MSRYGIERDKRSGLTIFALVLLALLTVVLLLSTAALGFVTWRIGQIDRLEIADSLTDAPAEPITAADIINQRSIQERSTSDNDPPVASGPGSEGAVPAAESDDDANASAENSSKPRFSSIPNQTNAENYLLVGTDSVAGFDPDDPVAFQRSANSHLADAIMVLRLRSDGTAALLSIPRDLLVNIADTDRYDRINSAYNIDSTPAERAARLIDTIESELDITLQHFVEVDFDGFRQVIDAVGGVRAYFERPLRDRPDGDYNNPAPNSSTFTTEAGWQLLDGSQALAYVRSRHLYEQNDDGSWQRSGVWNDLERNQRQREFLLNAAEQISGELKLNAGLLRTGLNVAASALATSDTLNILTDGLRLANELSDFNFDTDVEEYELSVRDVIEPGRWALALRDEAHNQRVLDVFRGIGWEDVVESRVTVRVSGADRWRVAGELEQVGFQANTAGAPPFSRAAVNQLGQLESNTLAYGPQGRLAAALLLSHLTADVQLLADPQLGENTLALHITDPAQLPLLSFDYRVVELPPEVPR